MPRKPQQSKIACQYFTWGLRLRDGVFYADGRGGKFQLGKHSLGTRDKQFAIERLKQLDERKAIEVGLIEAKAVTTDTTISIADGWKKYDDYCGRSQIMGGVSPNTVKRYRAVRDKHKKFCARHGIENWAAFDKAALEKYGNFLGEKHADRTVFLELTTLKSIIKWLVSERHLPAGSELNYALRKPQGTDTYCYTPGEVTTMIAHCTNTDGLTWLAHVIIALAFTGLRIGELIHLRWSDIKLTPRKESLTVADERSSSRKRNSGNARTTKGRRSRIVPIHPEFQKLLGELERKPDGFVLHAARGGRLHSRNILQSFINDVIEPLKATFPTPEGEIGFEHGRLHSFRHYFCSQAFLGGASEGEIKEWLGHADSKMVEHYRHLRNEDAQRKMAKIEFVLPPDSSSSGVA